MSWLLHFVFSVTIFSAFFAIWKTLTRIMWAVLFSEQLDDAFLRLRRKCMRRTPSPLFYNFSQAICTSKSSLRRFSPCETIIVELKNDYTIFCQESENFRKKNSTFDILNHTVSADLSRSRQVLHVFLNVYHFFILWTGRYPWPECVREPVESSGSTDLKFKHCVEMPVQTRRKQYGLNYREFIWKLKFQKVHLLNCGRIRKG